MFIAGCVFATISLCTDGSRSVCCSIPGAGAAADGAAEAGGEKGKRKGKPKAEGKDERAKTVQPKPSLESAKTHSGCRAAGCEG